MIKSNSPLVTVYITNYNYEAYLERSIQSVLDQEMQDFELIIIDDGSTDNSKEIIEAYRDTPGVSIIYQQNKGLNVTNNVAMRASRGKYLMRLDADDFLEPEALEVMSRVLESDGDLGLVFPDYYYVDAAGNRTGQEIRHNFEKEVSLYDQPAHGACTMVRLAFLKKLGGYNESFTCQDGYDLWIKFITHYKVTNVNHPLFSYRRHGNNLTGNEERILGTRQQIKEAFVRQHYENPRTLAVIPVRDTFVDGQNWPLMEFNGITVLQDKIETCLQADDIQHIAVTSADELILAHARKHYSGNKRVSIIYRPPAFEDLNQSLAKSIEHAVEEVQKLIGVPVAVMTVSLEFPFLKPKVLDEVIHTQVLFKADSVLTVRPDNHTYYKHVGHGMVPVFNTENFSKLERDALYKGSGGVMLTTMDQLRKSRRSVSGNVSHVIVDKKTAFCVRSKFELEVFKKLVKSETESI